MNFRYRPGQRAIKTALAVLLSLLFAYACRMENFMFAVIGAILCMQPTAKAARFTGKNQLLGTVIGGLLGYVVYVTLYAFALLRHPIQVLVVPVCILLLLYVCNVLEVPEVCSICGIVFISVFEDPSLPPGAVFSYLLHRMGGLSVGIFFAAVLSNLPLRFCRKRKKPYSG